MLDLLDFSSLDIHFDLETNALLYGENIKCNSCQKVTLKHLSPILLNKSLIYPEQVYEEYKGIYYQQDENLLNGCISYDLINLPAGLLGIEYIKTHVYYSPLDYADDKVSCIVEVLYGNLYILMQKNSPKDELEFYTRVDAGYLVKLKQGDRFVVPEGYLYTFVNASENNVLFSKVYKKCSIIDYAMLKKERGLAYYCIRKNGRQEIVHNPFYKNTPEIIELAINTSIFNSDIEVSKPLYESIKLKMDFLLAKLA
jgi:oxalate decarboxylase/phosphoglucose isomerase-like protein (cupin superfamily)